MIRIIPAIDVSRGRCVRLTQGDYAREKRYFDDPLDAAKMFRDSGITRLHLVDLDGAKSDGPKNLDVLSRIAKTGLDVEYGGGIKSSEALKSALDGGAAYIICGSVAVSRPAELREWMETYPGKIILGVDSRNGRIAVKGWTEDTSITPADLVSLFPDATQAICTDISRDGMLSGTDPLFYSTLQDRFPGVDIIASGGISSIRDIMDLDKAGIRGVVVGKAIYEGRLSLEDLKEYAV